MKLITLFLLFISLSSVAQRDTVSIHYEIDAYEATDLELEKLKVNEKWEKVDIISYTDYLGSAEYNQKLSIERSREIRSRLIEKGLSSEKLNLVEGKGIIGISLDTKEGIRQNRRTDVVYSIAAEEVELIEELEEDNEVVQEENDDNLSDKIEALEVGANLVLENLSFIPGQHFLMESSKPTLNTLVQVMLDNPSLKIAIEGHVCCESMLPDGLDKTTLTQNLSVERAKYVYEQLIANKIDESRLSYEGFGRRKPLFPDEKTAEEQQANRRVEIRVIEK